MAESSAPLDHPQGAGHHPDLPEWARGFRLGLDHKLGFELLEISSDRVVGRYPVEGNTQVVGLWHGGASGVAVETLASLGAYAYGRERNMIGVGVDLNVTHHRPVRQGWVTGTATPLHKGGRTTTWQVLLHDDEGNHVGTGRLTCQLVPLPDDAD
ncbi:PaaI family thioesterase [Aestuariimicrobium ganziense]|uniref:PaaI family thioesterase n=1 Tax=Aestuariimicrobium ganziense TaxID=2773677 RepID=UPI00194231B9|nr:PaaI family thioesterase [Aestuariimicrobium ganziense]